MHHLKHLEAATRPLEPDGTERRHLMEQVLAYVEEYLAGQADLPVYTDDAADSRAIYDSPITENGTDIAELLALLHQNVDTIGLNTKSGRHLGYIPGGGLYHAALGDYLAAALNRYTGLFYVCPGGVRIENMLLRWMADMVGYPDTAAGNLSSGGSLANLTAIVAARDEAGIGGDSAGRAVVYVTEHVHHCITKALHIAGLNQAVRRTIPVDSGYRMQPEALAAAIEADQKAGLRPWLVVGSAGTTNTGSVDPLAEIGQIGAAHGLWYHIDGAYGAFFALCPEGQAVLQGMDRSDSIVLDPHKTLFLPYGSGALLVKDRQKLYNAFSADAAYLTTALEGVEELSSAELSPELTRHFRGLRLWLPLKLAGVAPFRAALSEKIQLARYFYERIQAIDGFEVGPYPDLSVVIYRYVPRRGDPDAFNRRLMETVQREGRIFISPTRVDGHFVLRAAIVSYNTHLAEVEEALDVLGRTATKLAAEAG